MNDWIADTASVFWAESGVASAPPADIETAVLWALPLGVFRVPRLGIGAMREALRERDIHVAVEGERSLHACLVARGGRGLVLLDGGDPPDEQRFSLAHEAAHFMLDYLEPRRRALAKFGPVITDVLDGLRRPKPAERADALLTGVSLGVHVHLMPRGPRGEIGCFATVCAEQAADRLAFELLAPLQTVCEAVPADASVVAVAELLESMFGLPSGPARYYAARVYAELTEGRPFNVRGWLGLSEQPRRTSHTSGE